MVCRLLLETGRGAAWLAHLLWEQRVAGSNPVAPTKMKSPSWQREGLFCVVNGRLDLNLRASRFDAVFSGTDVPLGKHEEGAAILSPRPGLHREFPSKSEALIFDYLDYKLQLANSMYRKRSAGYREMGYDIRESSDSVML